MDYADYRKQLGLSFCDEEKVKMFLARAYMAFSESIEVDREIPCGVYNEFCYEAGIKTDVDLFSGYINAIKVYKYLQSKTESLNEFLYAFTIFINVHKIQERQSWEKAFNKWASESELEFEFIKSDDKEFIFPKGAKELDDALVSMPLQWLESYKESHKAFIKALKEYTSLTEENASNVADYFRKALETFFQEFFGGGKTLENYKMQYGEYLKSQNIPAEIANNFQKLLEQYTSYMNNYAKHHDKSSKNVLEYIMYQTGNIIRLLITLKQGEVK